MIGRLIMATASILYFTLIFWIFWTKNPHVVEIPLFIKSIFAIGFIAATLFFSAAYVQKSINEEITKEINRDQQKI